MKLNPNVLAGALLYHPAALYEARQNWLQERGWLVKTIMKYLDDPDLVWLTDDVAKNNREANLKKRKRQEMELISGLKSKKSEDVNGEEDLSFSQNCLERPNLLLKRGKQQLCLQWLAMKVLGTSGGS